MRKVLDLGELHKQLRQTEEHEPHFDEELNPYLLDTVLPQLEGEEPIRLEEIDFDRIAFRTAHSSSTKRTRSQSSTIITGGKIFVIRCATSTGGFPTFCRLV